ncbi:GspE/PulE family protein [Idiomarina seosinensis]|uniref:GspE/PulE family protein n=1 Tax=Idiomarina seosinensis TaxID=281739 RepID=UPI003850A093
MSQLTRLLVEKFSVDPIDVEKAQQFQTKNGGRLERILQNMGAFSSENLPPFYSELLGFPLMTLSDVENLPTDAAAIALTQKEQLNTLGVYVLAMDQSGRPRTCAVSDPLDLKVNEWVAGQPQLVDIHLVTEDADTVLAERYSEQNEDTTSSLTDIEEDRLRELASEAPVVNLLNALIARALRQGASDMHVEPAGLKGRVRYRIDGVLHEVENIPSSMLLPVITRLKILSNMDIAEKRRPQDGKIQLKVDGKSVDIRVSALPVGEGGESVVMRFLLQESLSYDIKVLGIEPDTEQLLLEDIQTTSGVILLTGPTGSGKTTSLYSFLSRRNSEDVKIITLEDPVEYRLAGINQVAVQSEIGYDFAKALRSVVRQDPDIIMVGEIRDKETANISMQAALTGHLVFSTLHTNDAPTAYTRLLDLGVEEFLINSAVKSIVAQRLVRKLCPECRRPASNTEEIVNKYKLAKLSEERGIIPQVHEANGCEACNNTGYKGRLAIIEYMRCDDDIQALEKDERFLENARRLNRTKGYRNLLQDGFVKALRGDTTIEEVLRVAG